MVSGASPSFGQRLRAFREAAGLTQEELAERAGISVKAIGALERGRRQRPYPHTVRALADALRLSDDERAALTGAVPPRERATHVITAQPQGIPAPPGQLFGRDDEVRAVSELLTSNNTRLVTMTGFGGIGKTRLTLEIAARLEHAFPDGVAFVPLAPLGDARLVMPTIAQSLGLTESGGSTTRELLVNHLRDRETLLVLDNFEHVLDAASDVADLLAACPDLTILVTSRAPLRVRVEQEFPVRPLELPDLSHIPTPDDVARVSSVQLFLERGRAAVPAFELTSANSAAVAAICRRLDGLPLALELAAARLRSLSPTEVLARLDHILPLLVGGSRDLPQRQQTMRETINWSHELLAPAEQALFRRLSIFAGGWTLASAEAVAAWGEITAAEVIDLLANLVEQSLAVSEPDAEGTTRYRMLEPIRQFAASRVDATGERDDLASRHLAWCLSLAQQAATEMIGPAQQEWLDRLEREHDDLRAALAWSLATPEHAQSGLQLAIALWRFWETRGYLTESRRWLDQLLAANPDAPANLRADALNVAGNLAHNQGDYGPARSLLEASLALRRDISDLRGVGISLNNLANIESGQGYHQRAAVLYAEALALMREHAPEWEIAIALHNTGMTLGYQGEYEQSFALLEEALAIWERIGESSLRARVIDVTGEINRRKGDLDRAFEWHEQSRAIRQRIGDKRGLALTLNNLGIVARHRGDYAEATRLFESALDIRRSIGARFGITASLGSLADVARCEEDWPRARELYLASISDLHALGIMEGLADSLLGYADVLRAEGQPQRAARMIGASDAVRESLGQTIPPIDQPGYDAIVAAITQALPPGEFAPARASGHALTTEQAIVEVLSDHNTNAKEQGPPLSS